MSNLVESVSRELVIDAIAVEQVSENTFLSRSPWTPYGHSSVYGGQVMSQAVHAASLFSNDSFILHSYQCNFLYSLSNEQPIKYRVYRLKHGRSFSSYIVKAIQNRRLCTVLMCWFQNPEPSLGSSRLGSPSVQWSMPQDVSRPEELELDMDYYLRHSFDAKGEMKAALLGIAQDRERIPIIMTVTKEYTTRDGYFTSLRWMKAPGAQGYGLAVQKCILAYMSDFDFIGVAPKALNLRRLGRGPGAVETISTLNHSMQFYCDVIDSSDWLLFVMSVPRTGFGRASVLGRFYTRNGTLIAVATQEGVVRAYDDERDINISHHVVRSKL